MTACCHRVRPSSRQKQMGSAAPSPARSLLTWLTSSSGSGIWRRTRAIRRRLMCITAPTRPSDTADRRAHHRLAQRRDRHGLPLPSTTNSLPSTGSCHRAAEGVSRANGGSGKWSERAGNAPRLLASMMAAPGITSPPTTAPRRSKCPPETAGGLGHLLAQQLVERVLAAVPVLREPQARPRSPARGRSQRRPSGTSSMPRGCPGCPAATRAAAARRRGWRRSRPPRCPAGQLSPWRCHATMPDCCSCCPPSPRSACRT